MRAFLHALALPASTADSNGATASTWSTWLDNAAEKSIGLAALLVGAIVVWIIARLMIRGITRSIETGLPFRRRTRQALERARVELPPLDPQEVRLEAERRRQRAGTIRAVLNSGLAVVLLAVLVVMILDLAGLPVAPLLASAGIVGVAFGFGAQSLVKDLLAGLFMLIEDQYGVGDVVDLGPASGLVEEVGLRSTRLRSLDGTVWYVPNGEIARVGNMTRLWSRAFIEVRLSYDTDLDLARQAMLDAVVAARKASEDVDRAILSEPEVPGIESFDYYSIAIRLMIQVAPIKQWDVMRQVRLEMRRIFDERGIRMAVPDQTLLMEPGSRQAATPAPGPDDSP
ncbi:MAG: mechanosensitive ion channel protein MscS [Actinobacteria bacterium HGW-Actinobacteria-8]|nr:MAG: mechanosensitive ion channel protein MscS [Actinobacteria bacterium HGW-Actinobacteria-8]